MCDEEERLGGDAAYVEASAAKGATALYARSFQAELASFDGSHVPAGTSTHNYDVILRRSG